MSQFVSGMSREVLNNRVKVAQRRLNGGKYYPDGVNITID